MDGPLFPHQLPGNEITPRPPSLPAPRGLPSQARSDSSTRGATMKGGMMGSAKLEEREGSLVAAKHPQSRPCCDAQFPSGAQLSLVRAQIRPGEGGSSARGPSAGGNSIYKAPTPTPQSNTSTLPLKSPPTPSSSANLHPPPPLIHPLLPAKGLAPQPTSGLRASPGAPQSQVAQPLGLRRRQVPGYIPAVTQ